MRKHWRYLRYIVRHKWHVFLASLAMGIPWLGLIHDLSKLDPREWMPYARFFYGSKAPVRRDSTGYYKPTDTGDAAFDYAWLLHQKRNKHHWQWWVLPEDSGGVKVLEMPERYRLEMVCDWIGAGRAQGKPNTWEWYEANKHRMQLGPETRAWVEREMEALESMAWPGPTNAAGRC